MHWRAWIVLTVAAVFGSSSIRACADEVNDHLAAIARAGPQASGSREARVAADLLSNRGTEILPRLLLAMDIDNPLAANWYRAVYETIVERELARAGPEFPLAELRAIVGDRNHRGHVRRLALVLCDRLEPGYRQKTVRGLLDDPEFREDAVDMALAAGGQALTNGDSEAARDQFQRAFEHARDSNQVTSAAGQLAKLGERVDIAKHLGLVVDWWLVGPFDAPAFTGFARSFAPESQVDLQAGYVGQDGQSIVWRRHHTPDPLGMVNLAQALAPAKEAVAYAYAQLDSPQPQDAQLRTGADDNLTVWLNGQKVFSREQWLNGSRFDRFVTPVKLVRGANRVLVKICQGPQHKDPQVPNNWTFQLRFCDAQGGGAGLVSSSPEAAGGSP
ncbi:MAG: hypothetical protein WD063_21705 [Pirellulales bacterium]